MEQEAQERQMLERERVERERHLLERDLEGEMEVVLKAQFDSLQREMRQVSQMAEAEARCQLCRVRRLCDLSKVAWRTMYGERAQITAKRCLIRWIAKMEQDANDSSGNLRDQIAALMRAIALKDDEIERLRAKLKAENECLATASSRLVKRLRKSCQGR